jgi:hypothetical protein
MGAQFVGLIIGFLFTLLLLNREQLAKIVTGKRETAASVKQDNCSS